MREIKPNTLEPAEHDCHKSPEDGCLSCEMIDYVFKQVTKRKEIKPNDEI